MKVKGNHFDTIWLSPSDTGVVELIDQRWLPFRFEIERVDTASLMYTAIREMHVRGAPLIGAAGALGLYLAILKPPAGVDWAVYPSQMANWFKLCRPTAVNLAWAIDKVMDAISGTDDPVLMAGKALRSSLEIIESERRNCQMIGKHGVGLIEEVFKANGQRQVNVLTHCNAGWLACIDYGTATAPIYEAHASGLPVHVYVDETRPRNQGARLTAWELDQEGVPCTVVTDNAGGLLMQQGKVDLVIVGSDRASKYGDVVNKIGTYLKALAARDNNIPFYAALPSSTIDWQLSQGALETPIEERDGDEVRIMEGFSGDGFVPVHIIPPYMQVSNPGFDITPARLVSGIITEKGVVAASYKAITDIFPEIN